MSTWRIAPALETLREQLNAAFPKRSKASDGGIGDAKHASRNSDHNPWVIDSKGKGVVTARDFTHDPATGIDCQWLADTLVANKDPRIKYIIWNRQICSSKQSPWKWRPYKGLNAHQHHLHLSVSPEPKLYDSTKAWKLDFPSGKTDDIAKVSAPASSKPSDSASLNTGVSNKTADQQAPIQNAENIVNVEAEKKAPDNFTPENKFVEAPAKEGTTATAAKVTIAGIVVPGFIVAVVQSLKDLVAQGYIDAKQVGDTVLTFIGSNQKYVFILVALILLLLMLKKAFKQVTLWIEMWIKSDPNRHDVEVKKQ